jgi:hypothetical protein
LVLEQIRIVHAHLRTLLSDSEQAGLKGLRHIWHMKYLLKFQLPRPGGVRDVDVANIMYNAASDEEFEIPPDNVNIMYVGHGGSDSDFEVLENSAPGYPGSTRPEATPETLRSGRNTPTAAQITAGDIMAIPEYPIPAMNLPTPVQGTNHTLLTPVQNVLAPESISSTNLSSDPED